MVLNRPSSWAPRETHYGTHVMDDWDPSDASDGGSPLLRKVLNVKILYKKYPNSIQEIQTIEYQRERKRTRIHDDEEELMLWFFQWCCTLKLCLRFSEFWVLVDGEDKKPETFCASQKKNVQTMGTITPLI